MTDPQIRDKLARISTRPASEWSKRLEQEFPCDPTLRAQALLWLHAEKERPDLEGSPPSLGQEADERYELSLRLDAGTTSSVWQAFDRRLGRNVAIKVFRECDPSEPLDQVLAEARAASDVVSEHAVRILDAQHGDGHPYIVMELVAEYDQSERDIVLGTTAAACQPRSIEEIARWVMQVALGVHEAHLRNVFHRDLKPRNVLITPNSRRARVADFGLAVSGANSDATHPAITLLRRGPSGPVSVRGTPEYMAPEQARGLPLSLDARNADDRAVLVAIDIWGLGAIAYDLLLGRPPWVPRDDKDLSAWEIAASTERPPPLDRTRNGERIPRRFRRVIEKAMATNPTGRYMSAAALATELQDFIEQRPTSLDRSHLVRLGLWSRRNPQLSLTILVVFVLAGLSAAASLTVTRMRHERAALARRVAEQKAEKQTLNDEVQKSRDELQLTRQRLQSERDTLTSVEKSLAEERSSYQNLIDAKEQALLNATKSQRRIMEQLDAARRDRQAADDARTSLDRTLAELRSVMEKNAKERDKIRKERDTARSERDAAQRERDAAVADRERVEAELQTTTSATGTAKGPTTAGVR